MEGPLWFRVTLDVNNCMGHGAAGQKSHASLVAAPASRRDGLKAKSADIDAAIEQLDREHRGRVLEYGVTGRLAMHGECDVPPLDDEQSIADANPVSPGGKANADAAKLLHGTMQKWRQRCKAARARSSCWPGLTIYRTAFAGWAAERRSTFASPRSATSNSRGTELLDRQAAGR
jgi:hypothetical protein